MAEKETIVGLPEPDAGSGIYKFLSMLSPTKFSVIEPRKSVTIDDMGGYSLVKPGQYEFEGFATPQIVTSGIDAFKAFIDDPVEATKSSAAEAMEGFAGELRKGIVAADTGVTDTFDPETQTFDRFDPLSFMIGGGAPIAYGTMRSIKAMPDTDGVTVGMFGGKDSKFGSRMQEMLKEAKQIRSNANQEEAFHNTSFLQRGFPEIQMTALQRYMGGGVNSYVIEHGGDLLHRMTENGGNFSELAKPKIKSLLRVLESPYGFEREVTENMRANHLYDLKTSKEDGTPPKAGTLEEFEQNINKGLSEYASLHSTLPVFNELQLAARNVAVALGRQNYSAAITNLRILDDAIEDGSFEARNLEFDPNFESNAAVSDSGPVVLGMMGGGKPKPATIRSLGGGKGGIRGLAHGIKFYDQETSVPTHLKDAFFGTGASGGIGAFYDKDNLVAPSERYTIPADVLEAAEGANMTLGDVVKEFGLSNRVRNIVSDNRAASAEIYRPGFSIGTDPVLSLSTFTMSQFSGKRAADRTEGMVAVEPKEELFVKTGAKDADGFPIYAPRELTMHDVQNLSPAQYLLAAYDPTKPLLKKPNTKYNESEIHVAEDAAHSMNVRELTNREEQDLVASLNFESKATDFARKAKETISNLSGMDPRTLDFKDSFDRSMRMMAMAVENPAAIGQKNLSVIEKDLEIFSKSLVQGYDSGYLRLDELYPQGSVAVSDGKRLYDAADRFTRTGYLVENGPYKRAVRQEAADTQTQLLRDSFRGDAMKYGPLFRFNVPNDDRMPIELDILGFQEMFSPDQVSLLTKIEMAKAGRLTQSGILGNKPADPKELTDRFLQTPNAEAIVDLFGYIDNDGVFRRNSIPNLEVVLPEVGSPKAFLEGDLKQQYLMIRSSVNAAVNKIHAPKDQFEQRVNEIPSENLRPVLMQIYDTNTDREKVFAGQINKGRHAQAYNKIWKQYRNERDELFGVIKELAGKGVAGSRQRSGQVAARLAGDNTYYLFRDEVLRKRIERAIDNPAAYQADPDRYQGVVENLRLGPRPGAKLYEEGGAVTADHGIGGFIPYMVQ